MLVITAIINIVKMPAISLVNGKVVDGVSQNLEGGMLIAGSTIMILLVMMWMDADGELDGVMSLAAGIIMTILLVKIRHYIRT
jgi:hypothetical protein